MLAAQRHIAISDPVEHDQRVILRGDWSAYEAIGRAKGRPDLAIEVIWTSGGLDKLTIYAGLGVRELWCCHPGKKGVSLALYALRRGRYVEIPRSGLLPDLDLGLLKKCLASKSQSQAVRAFRASLRSKA